MSCRRSGTQFSGEDLHRDRIYRDIEECETWEAVLKAIDGKRSSCFIE